MAIITIIGAITGYASTRGRDGTPIIAIAGCVIMCICYGLLGTLFNVGLEAMIGHLFLIEVTTLAASVVNNELDEMAGMLPLLTAAALFAVWCVGVAAQLLRHGFHWRRVQHGRGFEVLTPGPDRE